ncbi:MAG: NAD-dependent epimerase/dehydratase family protein, partial [Actinomycetota bacterium]|nr:NAD-dependent epimerase/dehydratase family protein [Actinomycetota bacterium]
ARAGEYKSAPDDAGNPTSVSEEIEIRGRRAAVTGAGGFIGSAVCRALAEAGAAEVTGVEISPALDERIRAAGAEPRVADISDPDATVAALEGAELVVHTAAYVREWGTMREFIKVNVEGTAHVLDGAEAAGAERVVHLSSVVVYGYEDEREQDESAFHRAVGIPYIDTKSASDRLAAHRGAVVVRPGDVYGPGSVPWVVRPAELLRSGRMALPGRGDGTMLPAYIDDLVAAILAALRRGRPGRAYTVWDGVPIGFEEYFTRLAALSAGRPPRKLPKPLLHAIAGATEGIARIRGVPPAFGRHGITFTDRRGTASNRRAREELGWEPEVDLDQGLLRSAEWLRAERSST